MSIRHPVFLELTLLCRQVLEHILSGDEAEVVVERIHDYLTAIGQNVRNGSVDDDDFIVYKVSPR